MNDLEIHFSYLFVYEVSVEDKSFLILVIKFLLNIIANVGSFNVKSSVLVVRMGYIGDPRGFPVFLAKLFFEELLPAFAANHSHCF